MSKSRKGKGDIFEIKWKTDLPYKYSIGKLAVKFFEEQKSLEVNVLNVPK
ncbi:MAG: hypothetical protein ACTSRT_16435 [Promethearchaeota archaeon]